MFVLSRIVLIVLLSTLTYSVNKEKILNGIEPIVHIIDKLYMDFNECNASISEYFQTFFDQGQRLFPYLTDFAESMNTLNNKFNDNDTDDEALKNNLEKIPQIFGMVDTLIGFNCFKMQYCKFNRSILSDYDQQKNFFIEFIDNPDMDNKNVLRRECNTTNGMKDVLTDLHKDIAHKDANNGTFNELLNGGVSHY